MTIKIRDIGNLFFWIGRYERMRTVNPTAANAIRDALPGGWALLRKECSK